MQMLAEVLLEAEDLTLRFPDLMLEASRAAYESAQPREAATITVYALALYQIGALDRAIDIQREAMDAAQGDEERKRAKSLYDFYNLCKQLQSSAQ